MTADEARGAGTGAGAGEERNVVLKPVSHPELGEILIDDDLFAIGRNEPPFASYDATRLRTRFSRSSGGRAWLGATIERSASTLTAMSPDSNASATRTHQPGHWTGYPGDLDIHVDIACSTWLHAACESWRRHASQASCAEAVAA